MRQGLPAHERSAASPSRVIHTAAEPPGPAHQCGPGVTDMAALPWREDQSLGRNEGCRGQKGAHEFLVIEI